jgi:hypothetical protein
VVHRGDGAVWAAYFSTGYTKAFKCLWAGYFVNKVEINVKEGWLSCFGMDNMGVPNLLKKCTRFHIT